MPIILAPFSTMSFDGALIRARLKAAGVFYVNACVERERSKRVVEHRAICHHIVIDSRVVGGGVCRAAWRLA
jgi:hypothetical protein